MKWSDALENLNNVCLDQFGMDARYIPAQTRTDVYASEIPIRGVFNTHDELMSIGVTGGMETIVNKKTIEIKRASLTFDPMKDDEIVVLDVLYRILEVFNDGRGMVTLTLARSEGLFW